MSPQEESREGVIRFDADHERRALPEIWQRLVGPLIAWRRVLRAVGWLGQDADRYGGYGYGNVSVRISEDEGFLVTGSQTSGRNEVELSDFVQVRSWSTESNRVVSRGEILPSSESLSHAALYAVSSEIRAVLHVHAPEIFRLGRRGEGLELPATAPKVEAGTAEMAEEIARVWTRKPPNGLGGAVRGVLLMGGHPDGVLAFGNSVNAAGRSLVRVAVQVAGQSPSSPSEASGSDSADRSYK